MTRKKPKYRKEGRFSTDSSIAHENELQERLYGPLDNKGDNWSNDQICDLLEGFLVEELPWTGKNSLCTKTGRVKKGVSTQLEKMAFRYRDKEERFKPRNPFWREGRAFSARDVWIIRIATREKWRHTKAYEVDYLSRVLMRSVREVDDFLEDVAGAGDLGFNVEKRESDFADEIDRAERIEQRLAKWKYSGWTRNKIFYFSDIGLSTPRRRREK